MPDRPSDSVILERARSLCNEACFTCESDFILVRNGTGLSKIELAIGECKTSQPIEQQDIDSLSRVARGLASHYIEPYVVFSKTAKFSDDELALIRPLLDAREYHVILFGQDELEPYFPYERSKDKLGDKRLVMNLSDFANNTKIIYFSK